MAWMQVIWIYKAIVSEIWVQKKKQIDANIFCCYYFVLSDVNLSIINHLRGIGILYEHDSSWISQVNSF